MLLSSSEESNQRLTKGASPLGTPLTGRACAALTRNGGRRLWWCILLVTCPRQMPPNRWVGSTCGGICPSLRSGFPRASLYRLPVPTAWPPALRAESRIPPGLRPRPPSRRGALGRQAPSPPRGPVEARIRPRIERQAGPTPPLDALRFAELPTALPGGERRLGAGHETNGGPSRSPPAQPVALEGAGGLPGQSLATFF